MFGQLKETVLRNLENNYSNNNKFKKDLKRFSKTIVKNPTLKEYFRIYDALSNSTFNDKESAREFLNECISHSETLNKNELKKLKSLINENKKAELDETTKSIDQVLFGKDFSKRAKAKVQLLEHLTTEKDEKKKIDPAFANIFHDILKNKLERKFENLNENELKLFETYLKGDENEIEKQYNQLIGQNKNWLLEHEQDIKSENEQKQIEAVKNKLNEMKNEKPTISNMEKLMTLKEGISNVKGSR